MISHGYAFGRIAQAERHWRDCLSLVRGGDAQGLARLYDETSGFIYRLALRMLADPEKAEAVTVAVYQQVWRTASQEEPECGILQWLVSLTRERVREIKAKTTTGSSVSSVSSVVESKEVIHHRPHGAHRDVAPARGDFQDEAALIRQALQVFPRNSGNTLNWPFSRLWLRLKSPQSAEPRHT